MRRRRQENFSFGYTGTAAILVPPLCGATPPPPVRGGRHFMTGSPPSLWGEPSRHWGGDFRGMGNQGEAAT